MFDKEGKADIALDTMYQIELSRRREEYIAPDIHEMLGLLEKYLEETESRALAGDGEIVRAQCAMSGLTGRNTPLSKVREEVLATTSLFASLLQNTAPDETTVLRLKEFCGLLHREYLASSHENVRGFAE